MPTYGLSTQIDLDGTISELPGHVYIKIRDSLDTNPADRDWRALIRAVDQRYVISPSTVERWSPALCNESPTAKLLNCLSSQGMTVRELRDALEELAIDTYNFKLTPFEEIKVHDQPAQVVEVNEGGVLSLRVEASGHPYPRYQWFHCPNGNNDFVRLQGCNSKFLTINNVMTDHAGGYSCQIHNCGDHNKAKLTEITLVTVLPSPVAPRPTSNENVYIFPTHDSGSFGPSSLDSWLNTNIPQVSLTNGVLDGYRLDQYTSIQFSLINGHPRDHQLALNESFVLSVQTQGDPPIAYQWYKDDQKLPGQTGPKLTVAHAQYRDFGQYYCVVDNGVKRETSLTASVKEKRNEIKEAPEITIISHPKSSVVQFSGSAIFSCEAQCIEPLLYQWFKDGSPLEGETSSEIKITNIQEKNKGGLYMCKVSVASVQPGGPHRAEKLTAGAMLTITVPDVKDNSVQYTPHDKVALLIGNSDYKSENTLKAPAQDIQALAESLTVLKFKVVSLLNLTKQEIENAVMEFCNYLEENVYAVFYFCGHGFEEQGMSFLVPTDAPSAYKAAECVCANMLLEKIQKKNPQLILMIMDICRQSGKVQSPSLPYQFKNATKKGNTAFCYATSEGLAAYENSTHGYGLLVKSLAPLLRQKIGIDHLLSKLKEEFARVPNLHKHNKVQIPDMRSNLQEPRRSLTDNISFKGATEAFNKRTFRWNAVTDPPEVKTIPFPDTNIIVQLKFESIYSNVLVVFASVINPGRMRNCEAKITNFSPRISASIPQIFRQNDLNVFKISMQDIQKLEGNLIIDLTVMFCFVQPQDGNVYFQTQRVDLGRPLISKLNLWQPCPAFDTYRRVPIETEDTDSSASLDQQK